MFEATGLDYLCDKDSNSSDRTLTENTLLANCYFSQLSWPGCYQSYYYHTFLLPSLLTFLLKYFRFIIDFKL